MSESAILNPSTPTSSNTNQNLPTQTTSEKDHSEISNLIGMKLNGYEDQRAIQDRLGFWCGNRHFYGDGKFTIERWENEKKLKPWLVLVEKG
jgi:hypothetical protein